MQDLPLLTPSQQEQLELFHSWKDHPVTKRLFEYLTRKREEAKETWADAGFVNSHDVADVYLNAGAISTCSVIKMILDIEAEQLFEDSDD